MAQLTRLVCSLTCFEDSLPLQHGRMHPVLSHCLHDPDADLDLGFAREQGCVAYLYA
jgi:hypothetical protein